VNVQLLIDSIVQQTTVLIAQLATAGGARAPLADVANQVFRDLAEELERQGLSRKVTADLFGISLRSYQRRVARLKESSSERGRTLWEAIFDYLSQRSVTTRRDVLAHFSRDDEELVRGVLRDLVETGLVFCSGTGAKAVYRVTREEELREMKQGDDGEGLDAFVWTLVYRQGPLSISRLVELVKVSQPSLQDALDRLCARGHVRREERAGEQEYASSSLVVELGAEAGWEASVYDHYQAMVRTLCARVAGDSEMETYAPYVGGSTYGFDVGPHHPLRAEVFGVLNEFRNRCTDLRRRVNDYNGQHGRSGTRELVSIYAGERIRSEEPERIRSEEPQTGQG
jgi:hypothetical protein